MKIRVYGAFLITRPQISKFNKKLYRQSKLLPAANKFNKSRYKSSFNDCAFSFLLTFLVFLLVSFPFCLTWQCFKPVSERARYTAHLKMKMRLITMPWLLISAIQLINRFKCIFSRQAFPNLLIIAENDVIARCHRTTEKSLKMVKINSKLKLFSFMAPVKLR